MTPADPLTNRLITSGYQFDAAGNMTNDGFNSLQYDGENRIVSNTSGSAVNGYAYDGASLRVRKCAPDCGNPTTATTYIFSGAKVIAEYPSGAQVSNPATEYVYSGSQLMASISGGTSTYYLFDHLSPRVLTDANGTVIGQQGHFPYGETWYAQGATTKWQYTGYERDAETGNDYAVFRHYLNRYGRFATPDPYSGSADLGNPQSWNRYAYVVNNPINAVDPSGLTPCPLDENGNFIGGCTDPFGFGGGSGCTLDGVGTPCSMVNGLLAAGAAIVCPGNDCSIFNRSFTGSNGQGSYTLVAAANGLVWINNFNGEELSDAAAEEVGLSDGESLPANLPLGTPQKFWNPFTEGFNQAVKQLGKSKCGASYGGQGVSTMKATEYRFLDLSTPTVGAQTNSPSSVFINSNGAYMTYSPTPGKAGPFGVFWTQPLFRAFILLHELGHQLSPITGFQPDAASLSLNQAQSRRVIGACF